ncbi:RelA/SpoT domain-containing protein, partial [Clostridium sp.]|uniref:RelA/SpoT domain-containing protein n=1 Tax=Clostridium sp. TaxID=1506 RepID=UPI003EEAEB21
KIIRKTTGRKEKYGPEFKFSMENYKEEINDLIGVRAIHIFKEDWEDIHNFIYSTWKVIEITANVREGDDTKRFEELNIQIHSRKSGYRSVHYLIEFFPTSKKVIAEIQVRTIFEEGYGEIDHQLRYSHKEIPEVLALNLLLFNRIAGSSDEMASLINLLNRNWIEMESKYERMIEQKDKEISELKEGGLK